MPGRGEQQRAGRPCRLYLLRRDPGVLVIARGPLPLLSGNKASVGYVSPLTSIPHYSFVGGHGALDHLQREADRVMLRKARAAVLLRFRGFRLPTLEELCRGR